MIFGNVRHCTAFSAVNAPRQAGGHDLHAERTLQRDLAEAFLAGQT